MRRLLDSRAATSHGEHGSVLLIVSVSMLPLLLIAALVIDLGLTRTARSDARIVVDNAAIAGGLSIGDGNGVSACGSALLFAQTNIDAAFSGINCDSFAKTCNALTSAVTSSSTDGAWTMTITHPVPDDSSLLDASTIGNPTQPKDVRDGTPCQRIGVRLLHSTDSLFATVMGTGKLETDVHAVAAGRKSTLAEAAVNLVILERRDCDALTAEGGGSSIRGIHVAPVWDSANGTLLPGYITVDSDGTGDDCDSDGVIDVDGSNASIIANGPAGCVGQIGAPFIGAGGLNVGTGCGKIQTFAQNSPGCTLPACTSTGTVAPQPNVLRSRVTRAPIDHRYNCKSSYSMPVGWEIRGCPDPPDPHIDRLVTALRGPGRPTGFQSWSSLGHSCTIEGPAGTVVNVTGDTYVDCPTLTVKRELTFRDGNVVFAGDVVIESSGELAINGQASNASLPDNDETILFFRGSLLRKAGQAHFIAHNTTVWFGPDMRMSIEGGSGRLIWTAPKVGDFSYLALWSESAKVHELAGQAQLDMRGIFFTPKATVVYRGTGAQHQVEAQFVARRLKTTGQGVLIVSPDLNAAVLIPLDEIQLIR